MQNRSDAFTHIGGDTVQMQKTCEELRKLGVSVDISLELEPNLEEYDIIHLFNVTRIHETWMQYKNAKKQNKKIVISTIHHKKSEIAEYEKQLEGMAKIVKLFFKEENSIQLLKTLFYTLQSKSGLEGWINQRKIGFVNQQVEVLKGADCILPNSFMELEAICEDFNLSENNLKYEIIPNGVETKETDNKCPEELFFEKYKIKDFVFCPGRIEPRKNQLNIINALKDMPYNIVFAGAPNKKHLKYYRSFLKEVDKYPNIHYIGFLNREMMFSAYKCSKVSVLASWFETTGLIGIEAALNLSNLVITNKGYTKEYFKDFAHYCDPSCTQSIKMSVEKSMNAQFDDNFKKYMLENYTWSQAAIKTKEIYKELLHE